MNTLDKKTKSSALIIAVTVICLMVIGYFMITTGESNGKKPANTSISKMQDLTHQVKGMESAVKEKEGQVMELVGQYKSKTGKTPPVLDVTTLSREEREVLEQEIGKEKDVSIRSLLKEILNKKDEIRNLKDRIAAIEDLLPTPHIAQKGESHYKIALAFLVDEKGVEPEKAKKMLARTALFDELAEGFKVWNFYSGDEYGTSVTQGDADVSPNIFVHREKMRLVEEHDKVVWERDELAVNIKSLQEKQQTVISELDGVTKEKEVLAARVSELDKQVNSMFYRLDSQKNLKKNKILKSGFLASTRMKDVPAEEFDRTLDLSCDDQLVISAADLGVKKIKDVVLYPRFYKKGTSYKVVIASNKKHALLTLTDKTRFKSERVVIAVK